MKLMKNGLRYVYKGDIYVFIYTLICMIVSGI